MAVLYDGQSGLRRDVVPAREADTLVLTQGDGTIERLPLAELFLVERRAGALTLGRTGLEGWRLRLPAPVDPAVDAAFPQTQGYGRWIDRLGLWAALAAFAAASAAVVAIGYLAPAVLAPLVPDAVEQAYGEALVGDFGGNYCLTPAGGRALDKLVAKLDGKPGELKVRVVDLDLVNAAALPGKHIVLFDALLEKVSGPDELAGILAHEIAHVRERHVTAALLRQFGVGIIAATLGGSVGGNVDSIAALRFTRGAEREADRGAIARLQAARINPAPTARFFEALARAEGAVRVPGLAYLSTHPMSAERKALFDRAARADIRYQPALTPTEWAALKTMCGSRQRR